MASFSSLLSGLGWEEEAQQEAMLQVMHFYGYFDETFPSELTSSNQIESLKAADTDLESINKKMQECLKRPAGLERAMLSDDFRLKDNPELRDALIARYDALGMIRELTPPEGEEYDAILILGSSQPSFQTRLNSLIKVMDEQHVKGMIYLLGSDRELWPIDEPIITEFLVERTGQTTTELTEYFAVNFPPEIRTVPVALTQKRQEVIKHFTDMGIKFPTEVDMMCALVDHSVVGGKPHIKVEAGKRADGSRASTDDTVIKFKEIYMGIPGKILIISGQPEALYQVEQVRKILPDTKIDIAAAAAKNGVNLLVINDSIARKVYTHLEQRKALELRVGGVEPS